MDEDPLDPELQRIMDLVPSKDMEEELHISQPSNAQGDQAMIDDHDEFLSLPNKNFANREDLICDVRKIGLMLGYAIVIKRSDRNRNKMVIGCDRGCSYRTKIVEDNRKKKSSTRLVNCPFKILGKMTAEGLWKVEIKSLIHNHEPSIDIAGHPYCRRFTEEKALQVKQMSRDGIKPRQILSSLRQNNPHLLAVSRNIYSKNAQFRREILGGRSVIQALLAELGDADFSHNVKYDQHGHLTHLFFAHPISIELTKSYPNVFVMDCTYKINKYKMPLLEIVGVSSYYKSFYSCFVFMQKEEQEDYKWALKMFSVLLGD